MAYKHLFVEHDGLMHAVKALFDFEKALMLSPGNFEVWREFVFVYMKYCDMQRLYGDHSDEGVDDNPFPCWSTVGAQVSNELLGALESRDEAIARSKVMEVYFLICCALWGPRHFQFLFKMHDVATKGGAGARPAESTGAYCVGVQTR